MQLTVKVCGMRNPHNISEVAAAGADWIGLIFHPSSPRFVGRPDTATDAHPGAAVEIDVPPGIMKVGVFVDADNDYISMQAARHGLDLIQLHGNESPAAMQSLRRSLRAGSLRGVRLIKALHVASASDLQGWAAYAGCADFLLFDTKCPTAGGSGRQFDWTALDSYDGSLPLLLSGGIGPDDADRIACLCQPMMDGIDSNSRFETQRRNDNTDTKTKTKQDMNRINELFSKAGNRKLLSLYFCAGCPAPDNTADTLRAMQRRGIDMVEVGIPFSDPMADGPAIQDAATKALRNGMTLAKLFGQLKAVKDEITMPVILMGYLNPILQYGIGRFCESCAECGVDGAIIPDLPFKDYMETVKPVADRHNIRIIMLITPETSDERIRFIDNHTDGFIYMVSSAATTGAQQLFDDKRLEYFRRIDDMHLHNPRMIGFGVSNRQTLESAQAYSAGAIIGSKFVSLLNDSANADEALDKLFAALRR